MTKLNKEQAAAEAAEILARNAARRQEASLPQIAPDPIDPKVQAERDLALKAIADARAVIADLERERPPLIEKAEEAITREHRAMAESNVRLVFELREHAAAISADLSVIDKALAEAQAKLRALEDAQRRKADIERAPKVRIAAERLRDAGIALDDAAASLVKAFAAMETALHYLRRHGISHPGPSVTDPRLRRALHGALISLAGRLEIKVVPVGERFSFEFLTAEWGKAALRRADEMEKQEAA